MDTAFIFGTCLAAIIRELVIEGGSARTGRSVPPSGGELVIDRQRILGDRLPGAGRPSSRFVIIPRLEQRAHCRQSILAMTLNGHARMSRRSGCSVPIAWGPAVAW